MLDGVDDARHRVLMQMLAECKFQCAQAVCLLKGYSARCNH